MESLQDEKQRQNLMRFFKTGPGLYDEGDEFLGLKNPQTRVIVRAVGKDFPFSDYYGDVREPHPWIVENQGN